MPRIDYTYLCEFDQLEEGVPWRFEWERGVAVSPSTLRRRTWVPRSER